MKQIYNLTREKEQRSSETVIQVKKKKIKKQA